MPAEGPTNHASREARFEVSAPIDQVLPLFGPAREADWADGWEPSFVTSDWQPGEPPRAGLIFTVGAGDQQQIWTLLRFDGLCEAPAEEPHLVEYHRVQPGSHVAQIRISASPISDRTAVEVRYHFTALTDSGLDSLAGVDPDSFQKWIASWPIAIEHYLETGEALPGGH